MVRRAGARIATTARGCGSCGHRGNPRTVARYADPLSILRLKLVRRPARRVSAGDFLRLAKVRVK